FSGGPFADLLTHPVTRLSAAMGVKFPARVTAGGGVYLEYDGRDVPDLGTVVADYEEGCQLVLSGSTITGYPVEEVIRGRLGEVADAESTWAARWEARSKSRARPNQVFGWSAGDTGSTLAAPAHQKLAGPWVNGKEPA